MQAPPARTGGGLEKPYNLFLNAVFGSMQIWDTKRYESDGGASRQRRRSRAGGFAYSTRETKSGFWAGTGGMWHPSLMRAPGIVSRMRQSPTCECECHTTGRQCRCKRIAAVEHQLLVAAESEYDSKEIAI